AVLPPPTVARAVPTPFCGAQADTTITLSGTGFVKLDGDLPLVIFTPAARRAPALELPASELTDCTTPPSPDGLTLLSCRSLVVKVAKAGLAPGPYRVSVRNPR